MPVTIAGTLGRTVKFCWATSPPVIEAIPSCFGIDNPIFGPEVYNIGDS